MQYEGIDEVRRTKYEGIGESTKSVRFCFANSAVSRLLLAPTLVSLLSGLLDRVRRRFLTVS
jgi:hypothetical protein